MSTEKKGFKRWYDTNGDTLNRSRKERYHNDPDYRAKAQANTRNWRENGCKPKVKAGKLVYSLSAAAKALAVSVNTLKQWEELDVFPSVRTEGGHFEFNGQQVGALAMMVEFTRTVKATDPEYAAKFAEVRGKIHKAWS